MNIIVGFLLICLLFVPGSAIECYRCNSTGHRECLEKLIHPTTLKPESCSDISDARYCIKTTGIYKGEIGDQRFCSSRDLGNYCEYIRREGEEREYRSCVYTCDTDGCNSATRTPLSRTAMAAVVVSSAAILVFFL